MKEITHENFHEFCPGCQRRWKYIRPMQKHKRGSIATRESLYYYKNGINRPSLYEESVEEDLRDLIRTMIRECPNRMECYCVVCRIYFRYELTNKKDLTDNYVEECYFWKNPLSSRLKAPGLYDWLLNWHKERTQLYLDDLKRRTSKNIH